MRTLKLGTFLTVTCIGVVVFIYNLLIPFILPSLKSAVPLALLALFNFAGTLTLVYFHFNTNGYLARILFGLFAAVFSTALYLIMSLLFIVNSRGVQRNRQKQIRHMVAPKNPWNLLSEKCKSVAMKIALPERPLEIPIE